ncbi:hypothetical protein P7K49_027093 [Saguinus oedipus]|uniref:Uncharacterized protein n=1 Tax=Saguinus oedipus TaxID=9490 RepID=A0ABQ9UHD0_SAGOE|nr:hypothetical protein P7K49_027093 [Saguinus oedipus]
MHDSNFSLTPILAVPGDRCSQDPGAGPPPSPALAGRELTAADAGRPPKSAHPPRASSAVQGPPPPARRPLAGCHVTLRGNQELRGGAGRGLRGGPPGLCIPGLAAGELPPAWGRAGPYLGDWGSAPTPSRTLPPQRSWQPEPGPGPGQGATGQAVGARGGLTSNMSPSKKIIATQETMSATGGLLVLFLRIAMVGPPPAPAGAPPRLCSSQLLTDSPPPSPPPPSGCSLQPRCSRSLGLHFPSHSQYAAAGPPGKKKKSQSAAGASMRTRKTALARAAAAPSSPQRRLGTGGLCRNVSCSPRFAPGGWLGQPETAAGSEGCRPRALPPSRLPVHPGIGCQWPVPHRHFFKSLPPSG